MFLPVAIPNPPKPAPDDLPEVAELKRQLHWAYLQIQVLEERLRLQRIQKYGPGSEKLNDAQLELLEEEPGVSHLEVQAESAREPLPVRAHTRRNRPHPGRQELPADLTRVERVIGCTPEQCQCSNCGQATTVIGYETSEQLDVEPAKYFVLVTKREKRACQHCEQGGVAAAPAPARIIEKGLVTSYRPAATRPLDSPMLAIQRVRHSSREARALPAEKYQKPDQTAASSTRPIVGRAINQGRDRPVSCRTI